MVSAAQVDQKQWTPDDVRALMPSVLASPWPLEGAADVLTGALLYEFQHGQSHALMAVRPVALAGGLRLDVVGLVSLGERMQGAAIDAAAVSVARANGCSVVAMCSQVPHVIKTSTRQGWKATGVVMCKGVGLVQ